MKCNECDKARVALCEPWMILPKWLAGGAGRVGGVTMRSLLDWDLMSDKPEVAGALARLDRAILALEHAVDNVRTRGGFRCRPFRVI